jgi:hypothetical protein
MVLSRIEAYLRPGRSEWGIPAENEEMEGNYAPLSYRREIL